MQERRDPGDVAALLEEDLVGRVVPQEVEHQPETILDNDTAVTVPLGLDDVHQLVKGIFKGNNFLKIGVPLCEFE